MLRQNIAVSEQPLRFHPVRSRTPSGMRRSGLILSKAERCIPLPSATSSLPQRLQRKPEPRRQANLKRKVVRSLRLAIRPPPSPRPRCARPRAVCFRSQRRLWRRQLRASAARHRSRRPPRVASWANQAFSPRVRATDYCRHGYRTAGRGIGMPAEQSLGTSRCNRCLIGGNCAFGMSR